MLESHVSIRHASFKNKYKFNIYLELYFVKIILLLNKRKAAFYAKLHILDNIKY